MSSTFFSMYVLYFNMKYWLCTSCFNCPSIDVLNSVSSSTYSYIKLTLNWRERCFSQSPAALLKAALCHTLLKSVISRPTIYGQNALIYTVCSSLATYKRWERTVRTSVNLFHIKLATIQWYINFEPQCIKFKNNSDCYSDSMSKNKKNGAHVHISWIIYRVFLKLYKRN